MTTPPFQSLPVLGLMLGLALAFLAEAADPRVRTTNNIAEVVGLPVLGPFEARSDPQESDTAVDALEHAAEYVVIKGGETLMREGDPSDDREKADWTEARKAQGSRLPGSLGHVESPRPLGVGSRPVSWPLGDR